MYVLVPLAVTLFVLTVAGYALWLNTYKKAVRYAVTLKHNQGAFVALCVKKRYATWTFVDVKIQPDNPAGPVRQAAPGELYVPRRNILYYQEIQEIEIANVAE